MLKYHVWKYDKRRRVLFKVTRKRWSRWDDYYVEAVWETRSAANHWGKKMFGKGNFKVLKAEEPNKIY